MKTIELKVDGLCCSDCAIKVENVLKTTRGVADIKTLITSEKAVITYDEADVNTDEIIKKIEGIGHKAQIISNFKFQILNFNSENLADTLRFVFIIAIGIIALGEIGLEYFGLLKRGIEIIPLPVTILAILIGGYPIFKKAFLGVLNKQIMLTARYFAHSDRRIPQVADSPLVEVTPGAPIDAVAWRNVLAAT